MAYYTRIVTSPENYVHSLQVNMTHENPEGFVVLPLVGDLPYGHEVGVYRQTAYLDYNTRMGRDDFPLKEFVELHTVSPITTDIHSKEYYFHENPLNERQQAVCRCYIHVAEKGGAYNPYAVCNKSVGTSYRGCSEYYNFDNFTDSELRGYMRLHKIPMKGSSRAQLLNAIKNK
jgi:hypothetical protein